MRSLSKELQALNQQNKIAVRAEQISACRDSGQDVKVWRQEPGICEGTFCKWQKRLFEMAKNQQQAAFAEVTPPVHPAAEIAVTIRMAGAEADIRSGSDPETIRAVVYFAS